MQIPQMIYGTAWKKERTCELVTQAIRAGFLGIDTACQPKHYHEAGVGEALRLLKKSGISRESLYIQTKFTPLSGQDPLNVPYDKQSPLATQVTQSFATSIKNLQTKYVDALILHSPLFPFANLLTVWQAMEEIAESGEAVRLGISNCYDFNLFVKLYETAKIKPSILQNRFYSDTEYDKELREFCKQHDIVYQSFWSLTANPQLLEHPILIELAKKYDKTLEQIFYRFLSHMDITPLNGTTSTLHMKQDLSIFDFSLETQEVKSIEELLN
jgi:diketogulonate reductase-like aldo/keto reductase